MVTLFAIGAPVKASQKKMNVNAEEDGERVVGGRGTLGVPLPPLIMNLKVVMGCNYIDKSAGSVAALLQSSSTPTAQFKTLLLQ